MATRKNSILPYTPGAAPVGSTDPSLSRASWDELFRIAQALLDLDRPVSMVVLGTDVLQVSATAPYERLIDETVTYPWQAPAGQFTAATGVWTCPQEGLYQISPRMDVPAFATPSTKSIVVSLRATVTTSTVGTITWDDSGLDDTPTSVGGMGLVAMREGDVVWLDGYVQHPTKSGPITVQTRMQVLRVSGTK